MSCARAEHTAPYPVHPAFCNSLSPTYNKWVKLTAADVHGLRQEPGFDGQAIYFHLNHPIRFVYLVGAVTAVEFPTDRLLLLTLDDGSGETIELKVGRLLPRNAKATREGPLPQATTVSSPKSDASSNEASDEADLEESPEAGKSPSLSVNELASQTPHTTIANLKITSACSDLYCDERRHVTINQSIVKMGTVVKAKGSLAMFRSTFQIELERVDIVRSVDEEYRIWKEYAHFCSSTLSMPWVLSAQQVNEAEESTKAEVRAQEHARREAAEREGKRQAKIKTMREASARYEERVERRRQAMAIELDGNPLDRPGRGEPLESTKSDSAGSARSTNGRKRESSSALREQAIRRRHAVHIAGK